MARRFPMTMPDGARLGLAALGVGLVLVLAAGTWSAMHGSQFAAFYPSSVALLLLAVLIALWLSRDASDAADRMNWEPALEVQEDLERLREGVEALAEGLAVFDRYDRLAYWNASYAGFYPRLAKTLKIGMSFEELLRVAIREGEVTSAMGHEDAWVRERLERRASPGEPWVRQLNDGRWVRIYERPTQRGGTIQVIAEVTEQAHAQHDLAIARDAARLAQLRLEEAIEALPVGFELWDDENRLVMCNSLLREQYPAVAPLLKPGVSFIDIVRGSMRLGGERIEAAREQEWLEARVAQRASSSAPKLQYQQELARWLQVYERRTPSGHVVGIRFDVSELVQREQQLREVNTRLATHEARLRAIVTTAGTAIITADEQGRMHSANRAAEQLFGYPLHELVGADIFKLIGDSRGGSRERQMETFFGAAQAGEGTNEHEILVRHRSGAPLALHLSISRVFVGDEREFVIVVTNFSERKRYEDELRRVNNQLASTSTTDRVTAAANRQLFDQRLAAEWTRAVRTHQPLALLMIDIDEFRRYNEHHGTIAGDRCLHDIAQVLRRTIRRSGEIVARYGGEEFAILLLNTDIKGAEAVARRCHGLVASAQIPHGRSETAPTVTVSVGVASVQAAKSLDAQMLVEAAERALVRAKKAGRNRIERALAPA